MTQWYRVCLPMQEMQKMWVLSLSGRSPGVGNGNPLFLLGESRGQRTLAGYSLQGHKESDTRAVIKAACSWHQNRQINGTGQKAQEETHALTFNDYEKRGKARICNRGKNTVPSISCVGKSEQLHVKKSETLHVWAKLLSCVRLCDPVASSLPGSFVRGILQKTGLGCHALLQGIFPTQGISG